MLAKDRQTGQQEENSSDTTFTLWSDNFQQKRQSN